MLKTTTFDQFRADCERAGVARDAGREAIVSVVRTLFMDSDTPVNVYRKLAEGRPGSFLLESVTQGVTARYSFVGISNFGVLTERDGQAHWEQAAFDAEDADDDIDIDEDEYELFCTEYLTEEDVLPGGVSDLQPVEAVQRIYERWQMSEPDTAKPLLSGLVGYLGWESIREFEGTAVPAGEADTPRQHLAFVRELAIIDHHEGKISLVVNQPGWYADYGNDPEIAWELAQSDLDELQWELEEGLGVAGSEIDFDSAPEIRNTSTEQEFFDAIAKAKQHIVDGDIFQVVLAQRFTHELTAEPLDVYRVLRHLNPSPYMYLLNVVDAQGEQATIVGSSPEALISVNSGKVSTHPIAGSRPRGKTHEEDQRLEAELLQDPKERSEHLMLVDLARNDLSRVCEPGSVQVSDFMFVEKFSHVMHISSIVEGQLRADENAVTALRATFPAGTLSGAPKPWALRIIGELEPVRRGVYGGVIGYFGFDGNADLAIAIRTAVITGNTATVFAGAGIVDDSDPASEYQESVNKSMAPLRAVAIANSLRESDLSGTDSGFQN